MIDESDFYSPFRDIHTSGVRGSSSKTNLKKEIFSIIDNVFGSSTT
jgi:hypothetical protein